MIIPRIYVYVAHVVWVVAWLVACAPGAAAQAQPVQDATQGAVQGYMVELSGAGDLGRLLQDYLEIYRHRQDENLDPEEFQRLVDNTPRQARDLLATEGYFSPEVRVAVATEGERPAVRLRIEPGEPTRIESVDLRFSGDIAAQGDSPRIRMLRRQWPLKRGDRFRQQEWADAKNALLKNLLLRDYPAAAIADSEARIDPAAHTAALTVEVNSGPAFTFGELRIDGLERYSRDFIEDLNPIHPGEPYSQDKLNELQARLQDTGYFRSVFASVEPDPSHPSNVPVRVEVVENPRKRLALGLGFSTDAGPRAQLKWLDRNFLERDWRLESELLFDNKTRRAGAGLFLPAWNNGWYPSIDTRYQRTDIEGERLDSVRLGARLTSPVKTDEKVWGVSLLADRQRVGSDFVNDRHALIASYAYTRRRVDSVLNPQRGYIASVTLGAGPKGVINEANIGRVTLHGLWLHLPNRRWQVIMRGQLGQVFGASRFDVPSELLFRTGGDQTVRGYAYNSLGVPQDGAIVGGRVLAVASAELVYRITPQWGAAVFTDAGGASDSWRGFEFSHGSGVGARWRSPVGPVSVDLAYGHETHKVRLHFSVGYGF